MTNGFASLHKVLKDETRRRIVLLLNEKGSLSYTDLMNTLEIDNTGRMNYHLKVLDDLIAKRENGQYALTEKGKLSSQLLLELPENTGKLYKQWIMATLKAKEPNYLLGGNNTLDHCAVLSCYLGSPKRGKHKQPDLSMAILCKRGLILHMAFQKIQKKR